MFYKSNIITGIGILIIILCLGIIVININKKNIKNEITFTYKNETINKTTEKSINNSTEGYNPIIDPKKFVETIDNPYYPLTVGSKWTYKGTEDGEKIKVIVIVTNQTKTILGVETLEVSDNVYDEDNDIVEETLDWYSQDKEGNVWYFGEDTKEYEDGKVISTEGSWEAGKDGALPGIIMKNNPKLNEIWRQEYLKGIAEDKAKVQSITESINISFGKYTNCIKTKDYTELEPDVIEEKYYCKDVGVVLIEKISGGMGNTELQSFIK